MSTQVLDNSNMVHYLDTGEVKPIEGLTVAKEEKAEKVPEKAPEKEGATLEAKPEKAEAEDADDIEGDDGLTPRQKRELTAKMLKAVGAKHRAMKEAEEFAGEQYNERKLAEARAERLEREIARLQGQPKPQAAAEEKIPQRGDFESEEKYQEALIDHRVEQKLKAKAAEEERGRAQAEQARIVEQAKQRVKAAMEAVPDWQEVVGDADVQVPNHIAAYMQESDLFAELGYHFAKHPEDLERISKLTPARSLVEVGKVEAKLTPFAKLAKEAAVKEEKAPAKEAEPKIERPKAPEPITPITTHGGNVEKAEAEMTTREVIEKWQAERRQKLFKRQRH